jgi:hypothetical protein
MQLQKGEAEVAHQPHRLGAVALAPRALVTDRDTQLGHAAPIADVHERYGADQPPPLAHHDRKGSVGRVPDSALVPFLLLLERERHARLPKIGGKLQVTEPAGKQRHVLAQHMAQEDSVAGHDLGPPGWFGVWAVHRYASLLVLSFELAVTCCQNSKLRTRYTRRADR